MKSRFITYGFVGLVAAAIAFACFIPFNQTIFALANRNLEMRFVVTNEESGEPIPNASIDLLMEEGAWNKEVGVVHLVTDDKGRVRHVHENNSCEDVIRPFRKTVTLIDLCWASVNVSAEGYQPIERLWLHDFKYDHKGHFFRRQCSAYRIKLAAPQASREIAVFFVAELRTRKLFWKTLVTYHPPVTLVAPCRPPLLVWRSAKSVRKK